MAGSFSTEAKALFLFLFLFAAASSLPANAAGGNDDDVLAKDADFIDELPNQPDSADFRQYSGYVVVEPVNNRRYFYYFVEADGGQPVSKPLILYIGYHDRATTGSPLLAAFQQVGPYSIDEDGQTLIPNEYSWNKFANLLFVDGPAGIGFALSNNGSDIYDSYEYLYFAEMYNFLVRWMKRFPEYKNSDVYIAGQGEVGLHGPAIANHILHQNAKPGNPPINIKGVLMGNPSVDMDIEFEKRLECSYRMNIISQELMDTYQVVCNEDESGDFMACWQPLGEAQTLRFALDSDNIYTKFCPNIDLESVSLDNFAPVVYNCFDERVAGYLNIPFVQKIMHVENPDWGLAVWQPYVGDFNMASNVSSSAPNIKTMLTKGVRALIFSGVLQDEAVLPIDLFIKNLSLTVTSEWRPWFDDSVQVAGFTESYEGGLTHVTVRGAGQKAMADQPKRTFIMAMSFLANKSLPSSIHV